MLGLDDFEGEGAVLHLVLPEVLRRRRSRDGDERAREHREQTRHARAADQSAIECRSRPSQGKMHTTHQFTGALAIMAPAEESVRRMVHCVKLGRELPGLPSPPWPGPLGQRIYEHVSAEAWEMWEERMKMILNEYRLMPWQKEAQDLVAKHMEDFFFGDGAALPPGYVPQQAK
jgi:Fe-S cluster biosynthesis and repair protein YggX